MLHFLKGLTVFYLLLRVRSSLSRLPDYNLRIPATRSVPERARIAGVSRCVLSR